MGKDPKNLGLEAEDVVEDALKQLLQEEPRVAGYLRARSADRLDNEGIDFLIFLKGGFALPIQVRSTYRHVTKFHKKHPSIRFILFILRRRLAPFNIVDKNSVHYRRSVEYAKRKIRQFTIRAAKEYLRP